MFNIKPLAMIFFFVFINASELDAQTLCTIGVPFKKDSINPFFIIKMEQPIDTTLWARVSFGSDDVLLYKVKSSSSGIKYELSKVLSNSIFFSLAETSSKKMHCSVKLIANTDSLSEYPILTSFTYLMNDNQDSLTRKIPKNNLSASFEMSTSTNYQSIKYGFQSRDNFYQETNVEGDLSIGILPIKVGLGYSTDHRNIILNNIVSLSFNKDLFEDNLRKRVEEELDNQLKFEEIQKIESNINTCQMLKQNLAYSIANDTTSRNYKKIHRIMMKHESDTSITMDTIEYIEAIRFKKSVLTKIEYLKLLGDSINRLKSDKDRLFAEKESKKGRHTLTNKNYRAYIRRKSILNKSQRWLHGLNSFDVGSFNLNYSSIVTQGVNLTGINVCINPGKMYFGAFGGYTFSNQGNYMNEARLRKEFVKGQIFGIGNEGNNLVTILFVQSDFTGKAIGSFQDFDEGSKLGTSIVNLSYKYKYKNINGELSVANSAVNNGLGLFKTHEKLVRTKSNAYWASLLWSISEIKAKLKIEARWVDPYYYTPLAFYLRNDNFRLQFKWDQSFNKKRFSFSFMNKFDRDNLYGYKLVSFFANTSSLVTNIKLSKKANLSVTGMRTQVGIENSNTRANSTFKFTTVQLALNYVLVKKDFTLTSISTLGLSGGEVSDSTLNFGNQYHAGSQSSCLFPRINLTLNTNGSYTNYTNSDSLIAIKSLGAGLSKRISKYFAINTAYTYMHSSALEIRSIISSGFSSSLPKGLFVSFYINYHVVDLLREEPLDNSNNLIINLQLRKKF
jgi:hypothetical protein